ncbi:hypothetical protein CSKR_101026 [Clonorchis sinensis]|nr:hypothetical protein CSKR_101026 [Clonorchis sinensis]
MRVPWQPCTESLLQLNDQLFIFTTSSSQPLYKSGLISLYVKRFARQGAQGRAAVRLKSCRDFEYKEGGEFLIPLSQYYNEPGPNLLGSYDSIPELLANVTLRRGR